MLQSERSSPTVVKGSDYKKMINGSIDSMDKSQFNSSVEDTHSYDIYEAHNPNTTQSFNGYSDSYPTKGAAETMNPKYDLAYKNEGFRDTSTFSSRDNWQPSGATSDYNYDDNAINSEYLHNSSTLPLNISLGTDSTLDMKQDNTDWYQAQHPEYREPPEPPMPLESFDGDGEYPLLPPVPPSQYRYGYDPGRTNLLETDLESEPVERPRSQTLLETNFDDDQHVPVRSKSEALLETNLDDYMPVHEPPPFNRSKSQPLETAM